MTEKLLHFIWQFQYFNRNNLVTTEEESLDIIQNGVLNRDQGPDFLSGKINLSGTVWVGNIELHIRSSDWLLHEHTNDRNYNNVILHVVWIDDRNLADKIKRSIPTLELQSRVSNLLLEKYEALMKNIGFIPCENQISMVSPMIILSCKQRMLAERLEEKSHVVLNFLKISKNNWEECFWWMIAKSFGGKLNSEQFINVAQSLPVTILARHKSQALQLEAMLFGQAGLLDNNFQENYPLMLKKEYAFLSKKYGLKKIAIPLYFLRMRPANFPTIRLAQLAMLINHSSHLFSIIKETESIKDVKKLFEITANDYWLYHYKFDELSTYRIKSVGDQMISTIIINTICPVLFAFGHIHKDDLIKDKAMVWLEEMSPEQNHITSGFLRLGISNKNAFESQALIQLKKKYCDLKRCLDCAIGNAIVKN